MANYYSNDLSEIQTTVLGYSLACLKASANDIYYIKSEEFFSDVYPIDIAIIPPTSEFDYFVMQTVGLSAYFLKENCHKSELFMVLPKNWNPLSTDGESSWPMQLLLDLAFSMAETNVGPMLGNVYAPGKNEKDNVSPYTDCVGGVITFPEMLPLELYEVQYKDEFIRNFQVVTITSEDVKKIDEVGYAKFVKYELHDSDGPNSRFVVSLREKKLQGIDKLVKQNEESLKKKK